MKRRAAFILFSFVVLPGCAEGLFTPKDVSDSLGTVSLSLQDPLTSSQAHAFSTTLNLIPTEESATAVTGNSKIAKWCVSELQSSKPTEECKAAPDTNQGWSTSLPAQVTLSETQGTHTVYAWPVDNSGTSLVVDPIVAKTELRSLPSAVWPLRESADDKGPNALAGLLTLGLGAWLSPNGLGASSSSIVVADPTALNPSNALTLAFWVRSREQTAQLLVGKYGSSGTSRSFHMHFTTTALEFQISDNGTSTSGHIAKVSANYADYGFQGEWRWVVGTYEWNATDLGTLELWVDGSRVDSKSGAVGPIANLTDTAFAIASGSDGHLHAARSDLAHVWVFNKKLDSTELELLSVRPD